MLLCSLSMGGAALSTQLMGALRFRRSCSWLGECKGSWMVGYLCSCPGCSATRHLQLVQCTNRCTKRHMYQNAPNVEKKQTQRDRSRCDDMLYWTKIMFYVPTVSRERPDNDCNPAKCCWVRYFCNHVELEYLLHSCICMHFDLYWPWNKLMWYFSEKKCSMVLSRPWKCLYGV